MHIYREFRVRNMCIHLGGARKFILRFTHSLFTPVTIGKNVQANTVNTSSIEWVQGNIRRDIREEYYRIPDNYYIGHTKGRSLRRCVHRERYIGWPT